MVNTINIEVENNNKKIVVGVSCVNEKSCFTELKSNDEVEKCNEQYNEEGVISERGENRNTLNNDNDKMTHNVLEDNALYNSVIFCN